MEPPKQPAEPLVVTGAPEVILDGSGAHGLDPYEPRCLERQIPGRGSTWVHGYSMAGVLRWRTMAKIIAHEEHKARAPRSDDEPSADCLSVCQTLEVCRRAPGSAARTFRVNHGGEAEAWEVFLERFPGTWVEEVCRQSDQLTIADSRRAANPEPDAVERATLTLDAILRGEETDESRDFWVSLDHLSRTLYGCPILVNEEPAADVLAMFDHDLGMRSMLLTAVGGLGGYRGE